MSSYLLILVIIGVASLSMAWMPSLSQKTQISYSILYVIFGMFIYFWFPQLPDATPLIERTMTMHLTELVVIISLMGTGLKIDQPFSFKSWRTPFRLVSITMVISIVAVAFIAVEFLKFDLASAVLLGAVLAPTDPVLASDVQVGPPMEKKNDNVRFSLTAEAGLNDGTAFPFTWLAILLTSASLNFETLGTWFLRDVLYRMSAGAAIGFVMGKVLAFLIFTLPQKRKVVTITDGFVGIAATLLVYGLTELVKGYGFIAVFVTAITLRNFELNHKFHRRLHDFTEQTEKILLAIVLLLFGGSLVHGALNFLTMDMVWVGLGFVLIIRPLTGLIGLIGEKLHIKEKLVISFFGIRGMGSLFYLSFALQQITFKYTSALWSTVSFIILLSVIIHGLTATSVLESLDRELVQHKSRKKRTAK